MDSPPKSSKEEQLIPVEYASLIFCVSLRNSATRSSRAATSARVCRGISMNGRAAVARSTLRVRSNPRLLAVVRTSRMLPVTTDAVSCLAHMDMTLHILDIYTTLAIKSSMKYLTIWAFHADGVV